MCFTTLAVFLLSIMLGYCSPVVDPEVHASPERQVGEEEHNSEGEEAMETRDTAAEEHAVHELVKIHTEEQDILNNDVANKRGHDSDNDDGRNASATPSPAAAVNPTTCSDGLRERGIAIGSLSVSAASAIQFGDMCIRRLLRWDFVIATTCDRRDVINAYIETGAVCAEPASSSHSSRRSASSLDGGLGHRAAVRSRR